MPVKTRLSGCETVMCSVKDEPDDFMVNEIARNGTILESGRTYSAKELGMEESAAGKFAVFVLQKRDWNTVQACREVARKANRGMKSVGFAGTKDRRAVTTQLCSLYGAEPARLAEVHVKDVSINGSWKSESAIGLGDLLGNRFRIRLRGCNSEAEGKLSNVNANLGNLFPNYYGSQRFGTRGNNTEIGLSMLRGDFEDAVMRFLTDTGNETNAEAIEAREKLKNELDFKEAMSYFPSYLKYELRILDYLSMYPTDFANALRKLPRQITLMLVHSVESYVFNRELETRMFETGTDRSDSDMTCGADFYGFPDLSKVSQGAEGRFIVANIVGYDTERLTQYEQEILDDLGITREHFRVKHMPELNCRGQHRALFAPYRDFGFERTGESISMGFSLPAGSYATSLLSEFVTDTKEPC